MAGSRRVQSARTSATFFAANSARTSSEFSTSRLLTWQVTHHAAVKSTNTGRPEAVSAATVSGLNATQSRSALVTRRSPALVVEAPSTNSGHATAAEIATAAKPATAHGRAPPVRTI